MDTMAIEGEKKEAALRALKFVKDGFVVGLGTGSTAFYAITLLGELVRQGLKIRGIPTSVASHQLALRAGIALTSFEESPWIDITIDGADEIDPALRLIKGRGGALLREKIVASASKRVVIIADSSKKVPVLGKVSLPVEVIPFAEALLMRRIESMGASVLLRLSATGNPFVTDEGHHIIDCSFGQIRDPERLERDLDAMPGVVEHGLFIGLADIALIGRDTELIGQDAEVVGHERSKRSDV